MLDALLPVAKLVVSQQDENCNHIPPRPPGPGRPGAGRARRGARLHTLHERPKEVRGTPRATLRLAQQFAWARQRQGTREAGVAFALVSLGRGLKKPRERHTGQRESSKAYAGER